MKLFEPEEAVKILEDCVLLRQSVERLEARAQASLRYHQRIRQNLKIVKGNDDESDRNM
jgi:hypothetical protein